MGNKRILFAVADQDAVADFKRAFAEPWEVATASSGPLALEQLDKQPFDVLVADLDLPELDGAALLNQSRHAHPRTLCFILATEADRERVMENVLGAHQFLTKPCDAALLKNQVERATSLDTWIASNRMRELVSRIRSFPTVPTLYLEVLTALKSPNVTTEQVAKIIARDMAMSTKLLQIINSACFGLPRKISDPVEAVGLIGFDAVKSMVMTIKLLNQYDKIKPVYFSVDRMWRHSTDVARSAKQLTLMHTDNAALAESAFTAGLIHDIGKVVLAANFDEQYRGAQTLARKQKLSLSEVEREIFGANHGEIGAYLLGLWGMPLDLLECAAFHHQPGRVASREFTTLTAVHIANALEHEASPNQEDDAIASKIDEEYLSQVGVVDQLETWRVAVLRRQFTKPAPVSKTAQTESTKRSVKAVEVPEAPQPKPKPAPEPAARVEVTPVAPVATEPAALPLPRKFGWRLALGFGAVAVMAALFLPFLFKKSTGHSGQSLTPRSSNSTAQNASSGATTADYAAPKRTILPPIVVRARTADPASNVPAAVEISPSPTGLDAMKLQGILFSPGSASAIIDGKTMHQGELISGLHVIEITATTVTLEYEGRRRTLRLE